LIEEEIKVCGVKKQVVREYCRL